MKNKTNKEGDFNVEIGLDEPKEWDEKKISRIREFVRKVRGLNKKDDSKGDK